MSIRNSEIYLLKSYSNDSDDISTICNEAFTNKEHAEIFAKELNYDTIDKINLNTIEVVKAIDQIIYWKENNISLYMMYFYKEKKFNSKDIIKLPNYELNKLIFDIDWYNLQKQVNYMNDNKCNKIYFLSNNKNYANEGKKIWTSVKQLLIKIETESAEQKKQEKIDKKEIDDLFTKVKNLMKKNPDIKKKVQNILKENPLE